MVSASGFGGRSRTRFGGGGSRYIIDSVNGKPVSNLRQFRIELWAAEKRYDSLKRSLVYKPEKRFLYPERYVRFGVRTRSDHGECLSFGTTLLIDDALVCGAGTGPQPSRRPAP